MAVRHLDLKMSQMHLEMCERLELSPGELLALAHLSLSGSLGPTDLTRRLHMTTGAMTAMLDRLAERGYITREQHATDRRRIVVRLTPGGRDRIFAHVHGVADGVMELTEGLGVEERRMIGRYLEALSSAIVPPDAL
jgi:DNA-binding MarR family transcriptional regulator